MLSKSRTLAVSISRPPAEVYHFVSNPENMPDWAQAFCESSERQEGDWYINTPDGRFKIRFTEPNPYGVLDHYITMSPGVEIQVPMRVFPNGPGSEVTLTIFQMPGMDDGRFEKDAAMVDRDLQSLKRVLEG